MGAGRHSGTPKTSKSHQRSRRHRAYSWSALRHIHHQILKTRRTGHLRTAQQGQSGKRDQHSGQQQEDHLHVLQPRIAFQPQVPLHQARGRATAAGVATRRIRVTSWLHLQLVAPKVEPPHQTQRRTLAKNLPLPTQLGSSTLSQTNPGSLTQQYLDRLKMGPTTSLEELGNAVLEIARNGSP